METTEVTARMFLDLRVSEKRARGQIHEITRRAQLFIRAGLPLEDVLDALEISRATWYRRVEAATRWEHTPGDDKDEYADSLDSWRFVEDREDLRRLQACNAGEELHELSQQQKIAATALKREFNEQLRDMRDGKGGQWVWVQEGPARTVTGWPGGGPIDVPGDHNLALFSPTARPRP